MSECNAGQFTFGIVVMRCVLVARAFTIAALLGTRRPLATRIGVRMAACQMFPKGFKVQYMFPTAMLLTNLPAAAALTCAGFTDEIRSQERSHSLHIGYAGDLRCTGDLQGIELRMHCRGSEHACDPDRWSG